MKVYLIKLFTKGAKKIAEYHILSPPQNIFSVEAATPEYIDIEMVDETVDMKIDYNTDADIIGIIMSTADARRAYDIAKEFKRKGKTVVLGGLHPSFQPDEALGYGDAVLIGEVEGIWENLLADYQNGTMKQKYKQDEPFDLVSLNPYPTNLISFNKYQGIASVVVSRGCSSVCSFYQTAQFFKNTYRKRPVENIVNEIVQLQNIGINCIELHADNLTADRDFALELFSAIKPLHIKWIGKASLTLADDEELLSLAADSGLSYLVVCPETVFEKTNKNHREEAVDNKKAKEYVARLHNFGVFVNAKIVFGFDDHDITIFKRTLDFVQSINIHVVQSSILVPTGKVYQQFEQQDRILTKDWSKYDGAHVVFQPKLMSPKDLVEGWKWFENQSHTLRKSMKKLGKLVLNYIYSSLQI